MRTAWGASDQEDDEEEDDPSDPRVIARVQQKSAAALAADLRRKARRAQTVHMPSSELAAAVYQKGIVPEAETRVDGADVEAVRSSRHRRKRKGSKRASKRVRGVPSSRPKRKREATGRTRALDARKHASSMAMRRIRQREEALARRVRSRAQTSPSKAGSDQLAR